MSASLNTVGDTTASLHGHQPGGRLGGIQAHGVVVGIADDTIYSRSSIAVNWFGV